ncbi:hypothetical protein BsWGS_05944 [Bradybaena similaris]
MTPVFIILILLFSPTSGQQHSDDYVDPYDMINFDPASVRMKPSGKPKTVSGDTNVFPKDSQDKCEQTDSCPVLPHPEKSDTISTDSDAERSDFTANKHQKKDPGHGEDCSKVKQSLEASTALSRQYVNKLVNLLERTVGTASSPVDINLLLMVSYHDIAKLRKFGQGSSNDIHDVYETLNHMVQSASESLQPGSSIYWLEQKTGLSAEVLWYILAIVVCSLLVLTVLAKVTLTWRMFGRLLFVIFFISVIFNWIEIYQKHRADQDKILMMERLSDRCPKMDDLSIWGKITTYVSSAFTFQNENCREYFQAMLVNPLVKATPLEAVSVAIVKTVVTPFGIIGTGIKDFYVGLLKDLPWQHKMTVLIILFVLILFLLFFSCGYYLRIFGLISLGPSESRHSIHGPPYISHQIEQRVSHHMLGTYQQPTPHEQVMGLEAHQQANIVPPVAIARTSHFDVSGLTDHGTRQRIIHNTSNSVNQTDCEGTPTAPTLKVPIAREASREEKVTDSRQYKQESGDGSRLVAAAVINSVAQASLKEGNLTGSRQKYQQESVDGGSLGAAAAVSPVAQASLKEGNLTESRQKCVQEKGDDKDLVVTVVNVNSVAHANLKEQDSNQSINSEMETEHGTRELTNLTCTDITSQRCASQLVERIETMGCESQLVERIETMDISRNS